MKVSKGFTLIELLIASTILSMVLLVGTYGYSLFADKWNKQLGHVNSVIQQVRAITLVDQLLDGIVPLALNEKNNMGFYFSGSKNRLTAISQNGILSKDSPVAFQLWMQEQINGDKGLWYREADLTNQLILASTQDILFGEPLLIVNSLKDVTFSYFGWRNFELKSQVAFQQDLSKSKQWFENYQGMDSQLQPEKIKLRLEFLKNEISLISLFTENSEAYLSETEGS